MGVKEGFLEKADMTSIFETMREAGVPKVPAFIAEIIGDPLNLIGVGKADDAYKLTQKSLQSFKKGLLEKTASKLYQSLGLSVKNATDEFLKIGNKIKGKVIEIPQLLGDELAQYGIKGSFEEMILQMKQKLPALTKNLRLILKKTSDKVDLNPIVKNLQALYNRAMMTGQDDVANAIYEATGRFVNRSGVGDDGLLDAIKSLDLKLVYDNARLTATKKLSDADDILKIIADGLREQINDISGAGKYNSEMSSYFEAMVDFSRQAGKEAGKLFSVRLSIKPPFIAATGKMAKAKTTAAQALLRASQSKAVKAYKATTPLMKAGKNIFGLPIAEEVIKQSKKP